MKSNRFSLLTGLLVVCLVSLGPALASDDLKPGKPDLKSIGAMTFAPDGTLFLADSEGAAVFAVDVQDTASPSGDELGRGDIVTDIETKIGALLGTSSDQIRINELVVHPKSKRMYMSVTRGRGDSAVPVLVRADAKGDLEEVELDNIPFAKASIDNAPAEDATDRRGRRLRTNTISDVRFNDGVLYVAGLSNEEFASSLRRIPYPFGGKAASSTLEIYHVAHGQYETHAPIRTFMPFSLGGEPHILASYTCTPLVAFPVKDLADGEHVKGSTLAELGAGNTPLDMLTYKKGEKTYLLLANSNRNMMRIDVEDMLGAPSLTEPLPEMDIGLTRGVPYKSLPGTGILHIDNYDDETFVMLTRDSETGELNLVPRPKRWM
ncbi:MAG TPA: hypothetical protein VLU25_09355 [Acidobacteriota bacterium]|nr:hypothetical protein [Acidobacteriota bacterium]